MGKIPAGKPIPGAGDFFHMALLVCAMNIYGTLPGASQCYLGNCFNGWGTFVFENGDEYTGQWANGVRTGLGVYDWTDGSFYVGYFHENQLNGLGIYIASAAGNDLIGYFQQGKLAEAVMLDATGCIMGNCIDGAGIYLWENGDMYVGQWVNGKRTGYGRYDWADLSRYIGEFQNGMLNGVGEYIGADGKKLLGIFQNNQFLDPATDTLATYADFCATLSSVLEDFPNQFQNLRRQPATQTEYRLVETWTASVALPGCTNARILGSLKGTNNTYVCTFLPTEFWSTALALYEQLVAIVNKCSFSCCRLTSHSSDNENPYAPRVVTTWLTEAPTHDSFRRLMIQVEAAADHSGSGYAVRLLVSHWE